MPAGPSNAMLKKMLFTVLALTVVCFTILLGRLAYLQLVDNERYQTRAIDQQMRETVIKAKRGSIYDRNMNTLATSASVWEVSLNPTNISEGDEEKIANKLAEILKVDASKVLAMAKKKDKYYQLVKRQVEDAEANQIKQFVKDEKIKGIVLNEDYKRYYPYGDFASAVLGFTGNDHQGLNGIEAYYEKYLKGTDGRIFSAKDAVGKDMPLFQYETRNEAQDGYSLVLTIDEVIQHIAEKNIETAVKEYGIKNRATCIVMNVTNGEVLAMTTKPDFDPNSPFTLQDQALQASIDAITDENQRKAALQTAREAQWRNKAISDTYEPGSVYKIITAASALEEGVVHPEDRFFCSGSLVVNGRSIGCWKTVGHGPETFVDGIKNSCNPVFMAVGLSLGPERTAKYYKAFGFSEKTGIDLPGETSGIYHALSVLQKEPDTLAVSSFGQSFKITPLQVITAVSAAINGGYLYEPHIVKQIIDSGNNVVETIDPVVKRQVISEKISSELALMLEKVVSEGSGRSAYIKGYRIGGKTGTSEKLDKSAAQSGVKEHILSFLGFAPADKPQVAVLVILDEPKDSGAYGSTIAAPVTGAILSETLSYLGFEPTYTDEEKEKMDIAVEGVVGAAPHEASAKLTKQGLQAEIVGNGEKVIKQIPMAGQPVPRGGRVLLYTTAEEATKTSPVPNVVGMSPQQANKALTNAGFNLRIVGGGINQSGIIAISQSMASGSMAEHGTVVEVTFGVNDAVQ
ncbi:stage V sporulation protein D (sporulation-specific penicillin-binding protein) [Acetanaerobacterium elongatum]|uniref:Stage V sporulation protein D (Sporulation-specific penicillin-binding protein) n=2 Tax=Acetanaerobacterium elongatum TaxID=258515 RepID=A0A1G9VJ07_9FIRM|nr:stage V sporulation protein D (sporulation-specific penicillin-binding protein) [Acetanaerobacterium elongatum]